MTDPIRHEHEQHRFVATVDGSEAVLEYRVAGEDTRDYYSTFVPEALRGRGIASELVEFALEDALAAGVRVRPTCPFVARKLARNPRYAAIAAD